jgi:flagellar basal-body rod protein FlgC
MNIERLFSGLNISAKGLSAQRRRMNAIASNIANAETTRTEDGTPYKRKIVSMKAGFQDGLAQFISDLGLPATLETVEQNDETPFKLIHDPGHPDADANGYVKMPNVNIVTEMVDMMSASRAYEANVTVINSEKNIAKDSLEI